MLLNRLNINVKVYFGGSWQWGIGAKKKKGLYTLAGVLYISVWLSFFLISFCYHVFFYFRHWEWVDLAQLLQCA